MKSSLFAFAAVCITALPITNKSFAQTAVNIAVIEAPKDAAEANNAGASAENKVYNTSAVSAKAVKDFKKSYKKIENEKWYASEDNYTARFTLDNVSNIVFYNKKGNWQGSLKTYDERKLDLKIRDIVKREYYDYNITLVQELECLESHGVPTYIVHIQDGNKVKLTRVCDNAMDVYQEFEVNSVVN